MAPPLMVVPCVSVMQCEVYKKGCMGRRVLALIFVGGDLGWGS